MQNHALNTGKMPAFPGNHEVQQSAGAARSRTGAERGFARSMRRGAGTATPMSERSA
jgi:hypothetical protein